jgi:heme-degrading monooxygenase HmoA
MVIEHALMQIVPGEEAAFEAVLPRALEVITSAEGCQSARVCAGVESPSCYLLLVEWDSVEAHVEGFRGSELFATWREIVSPFWAELPVVEHFSPTAEKAG